MHWICDMKGAISIHAVDDVLLVRVIDVDDVTLYNKLIANFNNMCPEENAVSYVEHDHNKYIQIEAKRGSIMHNVLCGNGILETFMGYRVCKVCEDKRKLDELCELCSQTFRKLVTASTHTKRERHRSETKSVIRPFGLMNCRVSTCNSHALSPYYCSEWCIRPFGPLKLQGVLECHDILCNNPKHTKESKLYNPLYCNRQYAWENVFP